MSGTEVISLTELLATTHRPLTVDDLDRLPDDDWRYELVDGSLTMSAAPTPRHQIAATRLHDLIQSVARPALQSISGGAGILLSDDTFLIPDLVVVRADADLSQASYRTGDVVLVVEVVSPSNASHDLVLKRSVYARHAIGSYWIVDTRREPRITVLELDDTGSGYWVAHEIGPDESVRLTRPFAITLTPADLT
jgi:Uma2 family endonuclease